MKNSSLLSVALAAGTAGVAMFALANSAFVAAMPGDIILGVGSAIALIGFAASDYARRYDPLPLPARTLRPSLPLASVPARPAVDSRTVRTAA